MKITVFRIWGKLRQFEFSQDKGFNPLSAKFIKWSNTLKKIVAKLPTICLSVFDHFSGLALKGFKRFNYYPANIYLFRVKNRNTRKRCE